MAEVIPQIIVDSSKVKNTWVQSEVVTNDVYNAINKAVIDLKDNNNLLDSNAMLFREEYNSSSKNLNNAIHQGIYSFTSSAVNAPSGVNGGNLLVTNTSKTNQGSSIITQIAFCHNGAIYIRTKNTTENFTNWILVSSNTGGIKSITSNNDTLTITKGDDSKQDIKINNVEQSKNINNGYNNGSTSLPTTNFRTDVLKLSSNGYSVQPIHCASVIDNIPNCAGIAFSGGWDTQGFLQMVSINDIARAWVGGGSKENINWYKELAFTESPAFIGTPTAPTPSTSDNSTKIATTAFVKSLFTINKAQNGWWRDNTTGFTIQWGNGTSGRINYPISFPTYGTPVFIHTSNTNNDYKRFFANLNFDNNGFTADIENSGSLTWVAIGY